MGYYSRFKIELDEPTFTDAFLLALTEITGYGNSFYDAGEYISIDDAKWYGYEKDLTDVSLALPQVSFSLERHGEESPDGEKWDMQNGSKHNEWHLGWVEGPKGR